MYKTVTEETFEEVEYHELPTELLKERLEALNARTPFQIEYNPKLESVIKQYLKYRKRGLTRIIGLSKYRSEEHTSELQSRGHLVCRLLLEKKNKTYIDI